ncbi:MAG: amino acid ABC transporter permease [Verrucomicrobia bacterium]|nr:amino acid ABC transporter permease [Verrucomicrobiota bacterium]
MNFLTLLSQGALLTLGVAMVAMIIGLVGGTALGIFRCQRLQSPHLSKIFTGFVWVVRGTPLFVQVLLAYYGLPQLIGVSLSPFAAGVLALGLNSIAYVSEIVRGGMDAISVEQWEAGQVLGLKRRTTVAGIILPQVLRSTIPALTNEMTSLLKETSILMVIGVTELTKVSKDIVAHHLNPLTIYLVAAGIYLLMTSSISLVMQLLQKKVTYDFR